MPRRRDRRDAADEAFGDVYTRLADSVTRRRREPARHARRPNSGPKSPDDEELEEEDLEKEAAAARGAGGRRRSGPHVPARDRQGVPALRRRREAPGAPDGRSQASRCASRSAGSRTRTASPPARRCSSRSSSSTTDAQKCVKFISKDIGIKASLLSDVIQNEQWRTTVDAEMDFELADRLAAAHARRAGRSAAGDRPALDHHAHPARRAHAGHRAATSAAKNLLPPPLGAHQRPRARRGRCCATTSQR